MKCLSNSVFLTGFAVKVNPNGRQRERRRNARQTSCAYCRRVVRPHNKRRDGMCSVAGCLCLSVTERSYWRVVSLSFRDAPSFRSVRPVLLKYIGLNESSIDKSFRTSWVDTLLRTQTEKETWNGVGRVNIRERVSERGPLAESLMSYSDRVDW